MRRSCTGKPSRSAQALQRIGKFREPPLQPIVPSPLEYGYRNRITVHVEDGVIGFFRRDVHRLIDIERCPISADAVNAELTALRAGRPRDGHYTLRARSGPRVFSQTNDAVAEKLAEAISGFVPPEQVAPDRRLLRRRFLREAAAREIRARRSASTGISTPSPPRKKRPRRTKAILPAIWRSGSNWN